MPVWIPVRRRWVVPPRPYCLQGACLFRRASLLRRGCRRSIASAAGRLTRRGGRAARVWVRGAVPMPVVSRQMGIRRVRVGSTRAGSYPAGPNQPGWNQVGRAGRSWPDRSRTERRRRWWWHRFRVTDVPGACLAATVVTCGRPDRPRSRPVRCPRRRPVGRTLIPCRPIAPDCRPPDCHPRGSRTAVVHLLPVRVSPASRRGDHLRRCRRGRWEPVGAHLLARLSQVGAEFVVSGKWPGRSRRPPVGRGSPDSARDRRCRRGRRDGG